MSIILPNLNHSFVPDSGSGSVSGFRFRFRFRIPDFLVFHTPANLLHNVVHSAVDIEAHTLSATGRELITDLVQVKLKSFKHFIWTLDNAPLPESLSVFWFNGVAISQHVKCALALFLPNFPSPR